MNPSPGTPEPAPAGTSATDSGAKALGYLRSTAKHGTIYSIGVILSRLIGFIMIPVYTRVLTPEDYGVLEILSLTTDVISMIAGGGIALAVIRFLYRYTTPKEQSEVASSAAILLVSVFLVAATAGLVLAPALSRVLLGEGHEPYLVRLAVLGMLVGSTIEVPLALLRARQRSTEVVSVGLARLVLSVGFNILFVLVLRMGVAGVLWSTLLTSTLVGGVLLSRLFRETGVHFVPAMARQLLRFGAPLVVWSLSSFVLHYSDRYFLRAFGSLDSVGLYSLSYKLAMLLSLLVTGPFSDIWIPKALQIERDEGEAAKPILRTILGYYNILLATVALGIALFASDVVRLATGKAFHAAAEPIPVLVLAMILFGYRSVGQIGAMVRERSDLIALSTALAAGSVIGLNFLLIPRWGVMGASVATAAAFAIEFLVMYLMSRRVYGTIIGIPTLALPILLGAGAWLTAHAVMPEGANLITSLALKVLALLLFATGLLATGALTPHQRTLALKALRDPVGTMRRLKGA